MGDGGVHWMDIKLVPQHGLNPNQVITAIGAAVKTGSKTGGGEAQHVFRVVGENRVIAVLMLATRWDVYFHPPLVLVLNGGVTGALEAVNEVAEGCVDITTVPTRSYRGFAENVLGVDPAITKSGGGIGDKGRILWINVVVEYKGLSQHQLIDTWRREAEAVLPSIAQGLLNMELYKVAGKRELNALCRLEDIESWDDALWNLPLFVENGDQTATFAKSLDFL